MPEGRSVTTDDGSCFIHVDYIGTGRSPEASSPDAPLGGLYHVQLSVTVGGEHPQKFKNVASGTRLRVETQAAVYYVDVHEIEEKKVSIEVTRELIPKPPQK